MGEVEDPLLGALAEIVFLLKRIEERLESQEGHLATIADVALAARAANGWAWR